MQSDATPRQRGKLGPRRLRLSFASGFVVGRNPPEEIDAKRGDHCRPAATDGGIPGLIVFAVRNGIMSRRSLLRSWLRRIRPEIRRQFFRPCINIPSQGPLHHHRFPDDLQPRRGASDFSPMYRRSHQPVFVEH